MRRRFLGFLLLPLLFAFCQTEKQKKQDIKAGSSDVMLQGFYWRAKHDSLHGDWYNYLVSKAQDIRESGITMVWFPPASKPVRWDLDEYGDWASACGYVPMDYYDLGEYQQWIQDGWPPDNETEFKMDGQWYQHQGSETLYGSREELELAIKTLHEKNIKVIADIVLNHRGARQENACGERISWGGEHGQVESGKLVWGLYENCDPPQIITADGGGGGDDDGEAFFTPNVAHQNEQVRIDLKEWMRWLKEEIGFDGWRYDYVKGFAAEHIMEYNDFTQPVLSVGEFWDWDTNNVLKWIDETHTTPENQSMAFDFPTKKILTDLFPEEQFQQLKSLPGLVGQRPEKSVTFLDNHDTHPPASHPFQFPDDKLMQGYAYILTHPGIPCVFWRHFYDKSGDIHNQIKELIQIRKENHITNTSTVSVFSAMPGFYIAEIDAKLLVKIGSRSWEPTQEFIQGYSLEVKYEDYEIWVKM